MTGQGRLVGVTPPPSRQIAPRRLMALLQDPDKGRAGRAMQAMMQMVKIDIAAIEAAADGV